MSLNLFGYVCLFASGCFVCWLVIFVTKPFIFGFLCFSDLSSSSSDTVCVPVSFTHPL
uniref:Uncharacterized protein n=1 Tax=Anguilla anguilla TaxID=7936 RepID=A0A0E9SMZ5_ANGAN